MNVLALSLWENFLWGLIYFDQFSIVKLLPLGTVDDLVHYSTQPAASCNSASGSPRHLGVIVSTIQQTGMK